MFAWCHKRISWKDAFRARSGGQSRLAAVCIFCTDSTACTHPTLLGERIAFQTPDQTPDGPVPAQVPLPRNPLNRPIPCALRGPATAFIRTCPEAETRPTN